MEKTIRREMEAMVTEQHYPADLDTYLKACIAEKASEQSKWSTITLIVHRMFGGDGEHPKMLRVAACVELLMLALDIVDDLQDQDNVDKLWMKREPSITLNVVLAFIVSALGELGRMQEENHVTPHPELSVHTVCQAIAGSIHGQQLDISDAVHTEEAYMDMVRRKSGTLLRLACYAGYAGVKRCSPDQIAIVDEIAVNIGIMAQLENDLKDVQRFDLKNDLLHKKKTLPTLFLLGDDDDAFPIIKLYFAGQITREAFLTYKKETLDYIADSGVIEYTQTILSLHYDHVQALYEKLEALSPWKEQFRAMTFGSYAWSEAERLA